jgi:hypothetical protein
MQCKCGTLKGTVSLSQGVNRAVCYCRDCQAFAHFLGKASETLDAQGGTDVIQTLPARLTFTAGQEVLACVRLSEKGLVRWYAKCCNTPVGNTLIDYRISFIGLVHTCLQTPEKSLDSSFGPVRIRSFTTGAKGGVVKSNPLAMMGAILRLIAMVGGCSHHRHLQAHAIVFAGYRRTHRDPEDTRAAERAAVYKNV